MDFMQSLKISASALTAHRTKMNVISENLANSETTRTADGTPYKRKMVVMESKPVRSFQDTLNDTEHEYTGVEVSKVVSSQEDFRLVYNPGHPDADPVTGYVKMPNVNILTEMADLMVARRSYDASVTVVSNTKSMITTALEIGK
jgi:flagellar basal-body rod protein FlgC